MTVQDAAKFLAYLNVCYPHVTVDEMAPTIWADLFQDEPLDLMMTVAKKHVTVSKFFPTPSEMRWSLIARDALADVRAMMGHPERGSFVREREVPTPITAKNGEPF